MMTYRKKRAIFELGGLVMIIARSPLRITLGGGGTDLPSYYQQHGGFLVTAAIDKYVYATVTRPFSPGVSIKYSKIENVTLISQIAHPIVREVLDELELRTPQIEISTMADIPSGTGLGSSGSFTTALIKAVFTHYKRTIHAKELAELACKIELEKLREPIGKQDQFIAAYGGITCLTFEANGKILVEPLKITVNIQHDLEDNLLLFFTGKSRSASSILLDQNNRSNQKDKIMLENLHITKEIGLKSKEALESGDTKQFGELMNQHWEHKKSRSQGMSDDRIDLIYKTAIANGALGGKLVGAGGGGFLMFYASDKEKLRTSISKFNLEEVRFGFDFEGTKVVLS
jgi:D-glycero-alpha-D-manno-heptose-7-phosphate kinase